MMSFIDAHRERFGVEPICRVLREHGVPIVPSTYRAARKRPRSPRQIGQRSGLPSLPGHRATVINRRRRYGARRATASVMTARPVGAFFVSGGKARA